MRVVLSRYSSITGATRNICTSVMNRFVSGNWCRLSFSSSSSMPKYLWIAWKTFSSIRRIENDSFSRQVRAAHAINGSTELIQVTNFALDGKRAIHAVSSFFGRDKLLSAGTARNVAIYISRFVFAVRFCRRTKMCDVMQYSCHSMVPVVNRGQNKIRAQKCPNAFLSASQT